MLSLSEKVIFPLCSFILFIMVMFLLLSVSGWSLEDFDEQDRGRSYHLNLGQSALIASFTVILKCFQSLVAVAQSLPTLFGYRHRGLLLRTRADGAPTSLPLHISCMSLMSLSQTWATWWRQLVLIKPSCRATKENFTLASFELKAFCSFQY